MWVCPLFVRFGFRDCLKKRATQRVSGKKTLGVPGHTRDTRVHGSHSLAHSYTRPTSQPSRIRPSQPINAISHVSRVYPTCISHVSYVRSSSQVCLPCNSYRGAQRR
jgi:hypothetical protein